MRATVVRLLVLATLVPAWAAGQQPGELLRLAEQRYAEGRLEEAADLYHRLAEAQASDAARAGALINAGWLEHRLGRDEAAIETLTRALALDPEHPFAPANYTAEFVDLYYEAERRAVEARARDALARGRRGTELLGEGDAGTARESLAEAVALRPDDPVLLHNLAVAELQLGHTDAAVAGFQKLLSLHRAGVVELAPELLAGTLSTLGGLFFHLGSYEDATENLTAALELVPDDAEAWHSLGAARRQLGDLAGAEQALRRALELAPGDAAVVRNLARTLTEAGAWRRIVEVVPPMVEARPDLADLWLTLGTAYRRLGDPGRAIAALDRVVTADLGNLQGLARQASAHLAFLHLGARDFDRAAEAATRVTRWDPKSAEGWSYLGLAEQGRGRHAEAAAAFRRQLELEADNAEAWNNLGSAQVAAGRVRDAETAFETALRHDPDLELAASNLAGVRDRYAAAARALGFELADHPAGGARIERVTPGSAADVAKLRAGDVLVRVAGRPIATARELRLYLFENPPAGDQLFFEMRREGKLKRIKMRLR